MLVHKLPLESHESLCTLTINRHKADAQHAEETVRDIYDLRCFTSSLLTQPCGNRSRSGVFDVFAVFTTFTVIIVFKAMKVAGGNARDTLDRCGQLGSHPTQ